MTQIFIVVSSGGQLTFLGVCNVLTLAKTPRSNAQGHGEVGSQRRRQQQRQLQLPQRIKRTKQLSLALIAVNGKYSMYRCNAKRACWSLAISQTCVQV